MYKPQSFAVQHNSFGGTRAVQHVAAYGVSYGGKVGAYLVRSARYGRGVNEGAFPYRLCFPQRERGLSAVVHDGDVLCVAAQKGQTYLPFALQNSFCQQAVGFYYFPAAQHISQLTAAPAFAPDVAALAVNYLRSCGKTVDANADFCGKRQKPVCTKGMEEDKLQQLIESDADFGRVVCRCEQVTLGEIKQAINNPLGVATVDGVKRRVRAGMGRCQGGFCLPTVLKTIAEQKGVRLSQVCKGDEGSYVAAGEIKSGE